MAPSEPPKHETGETFADKVVLNSVKSINSVAGVIGQPALLVGVNVKVTCPVVPGSGDQVVETAGPTPATAPGLVIEIVPKVPPFEEDQSPVSVSVTYPSIDITGCGV